MRRGTVPDQVTLGINCGAACQASQNIAPALAAMPEGEWQTLRINLGCMQAQGLNLTQVSNVFSLSSAGALQLSLLDARLQATSSEPALACP